MIKKNKNVESKDKNKKKQLETKSKQNITLKHKAGTPVIPLKRIKTTTLNKKQFNKNSKIFNSITSKEETKKKTSPTLRNRQNNQTLGNNNNNITNCNKFFSSNNLFSTRDTDSICKEKESQFKNCFKKNNNKILKTNSNKVNDLFKKNFLKQTIIIDNEGNNNLNLDLNHFGQNDFKNILYYNNNKNDIFNDNNDNNNAISLHYNTETNSLFESSQSNKNSENKDNQGIDIKQNPIEKIEEEKRIKEYNKIFNLLNTNIEQFKKMFNKNNIINKDKNKKIIIKKKGNDTKTIPADNINHRKYKIIKNNKGNNYELNFKKNLSEENLRTSTKCNKNKLDIDIKIDNSKINNNNNDFKLNLKNNNDLKSNYSFLESSIDNDFYQALLNQTVNQTLLENITRTSLDINIYNISNNENAENNDFRKSLTEENKKIFCNKYGKKAANININSNKENLKNNQNNSINQKILIKNKTLEKLNRKQIDDDNQNDYQSYTNEMDNKNCNIF